VKTLVVLLLSSLLSISVAQAQLLIPGTNLTVTTVNGGTGSLVSIPIPGDSGLSITVGQGSAALPLQQINNLTDSTLIQLGDDGWRDIPLPFQFPYWGQVFDKSTMYSNGVVQFGRPVGTGWPNWNNAFCCHGEDLRNSTNSGHNYSIMPLWTDLVDTTGQTGYYRGTENSMTYGWYGIRQFGDRNASNTFELKINNTGTFDVRYGGTFISPSQGVTIGMTGDLSQGQYVQLHHGMGFTGPTTGFSWGALSGTGAVDQCIINPLSSPTCAGYQAAYFTQQCTISALFDPSCPGYQISYFNLQCSANALYNVNCPGYQTAYFNQQCSLNTLYNVNCPGYASAYLQQQCTANPLYSTTCDGYATAYHDQQCSINPLYATTCAGYAVAYHNQQCTANPLYSTTCSGYAAAYKSQQCTISALYATDCPGYAQAYFSQQCSLDGLYDRTCPNYSTAYATKMVLEQQGTASIVATAGTVARNDPANQPVSTTTASATVGSDGAVAVGVSKTGDSNVDKAIAPPPPSANSATAPAGAVQLAPPPPAPQQQMAQNEPKGNEPKGGGNKQEDKKDDAPKGTGGNSPSQNTGNTQASSDKPAAPTARQALQERREAAAKAEAVEKGKNLAGEMGKASDLEAQKAVQNVVIQAMGFTPGFDAYSTQIIVQQQFYKPYQVYGNQKNIDNRANLRMFGGTDSLHQQMIESQYNKGN
jgi:hypothetical protein